MLPCWGADFAPGLRKVLKSASLGCALGLKEVHMHLHDVASCTQSWISSSLDAHSFNIHVCLYVHVSR